MSGQKKAKETGQTQAASAESPGNALHFLANHVLQSCLTGSVMDNVLLLTLQAGSRCLQILSVPIMHCGSAGADESQGKVPQESKRGSRTRNPQE